jgi:hypothetical protein
MLTQHFAQKYPTWDAERIAAGTPGELDDALAQARDGRQGRARGGRVTGVRRAERMIGIRRSTAAGMTARARWSSRTCRRRGSPIDPTTGLSPKRHFALEALAAFGTNTPPADNFALYKRVADIVKTAPDDLSRPELMEWLRERAITSERVPGGRRGRERERVFGMDPMKPGIPALRALIEGSKTELGGRKIESYFHNLAGIQRENAIGQMIEPTTNDRWVLRAMGLPTEIPLRTDEPVYRRTPAGEPVLDPRTGQPLVRGGDRRVKQLTSEVDPAREAQLQQQLMAEATKRAEARGRPITPREVARIEREAQVLAQQFTTPTVRQAHRSTAQGSEYVSSKTIADVGYEMTERTVTEAARRKGMDPAHAQAALWFRRVAGATCSAAARARRDCRSISRRCCEAPPTSRLDPLIAGTPKRWSPEVRRGRREAAQRARRAALARDVTDSIEANGGATFALGGQGPRRQRRHCRVDLSRAPADGAARREEREGRLDPGGRGVHAGQRRPAAQPRLRHRRLGCPALTPAQRRAGQTAVKFGGREVPPGALVLDVVATPSRGHNNLIAKTLGMEFNQYSRPTCWSFRSCRPAACRGEAAARPRATPPRRGGRTSTRARACSIPRRCRRGSPGWRATRVSALPAAWRAMLAEWRSALEAEQAAQCAR